jgi:murein DD-endopeptidase MepM/ murein hydrolase activator NlpD
MAIATATDAGEMPSKFLRLAGLLLAMVLVTQAYVGANGATSASASERRVKTLAWASVRSAAATWNAPLPEPVSVSGEFHAPLTRYGSGHRGLDLAATDSEVLLAPTNGVVSFAGQVGGKPVVSFQTTDGLRVSFEPACTQLVAGASVSAGSLLGTVCALGSQTQAGGANGYLSHCAPLLCLHWGVRNQFGYLSPRLFWGGLQPSRLIA